MTSKTSSLSLLVSIEGEKILIKAQDIKPSGRPKKEFICGKTVFCVDVKKRGEATIIEEYDPRQYKYNPNSMLKINSTISGKTMSGFSTNLVTPSDVITGHRGRTSAHTGQELTIKGICFMSLVSEWTGQSISVHLKDILFQQ